MLSMLLQIKWTAIWFQASFFCYCTHTHAKNLPPYIVSVLHFGEKTLGVFSFDHCKPFRAQIRVEKVGDFRRLCFLCSALLCPLHLP